MAGLGNTIAELVVKVSADVSGLTKGLNAATGQVNGLSSALSAAGSKTLGWGAGLTAGLTVPLVSFFKSSAQGAGELQTAMAAIQTIGGQTNDELNALRDTFIGMSMDQTVTTKTALDLAEGFYFIQGSGFQGADAMNILTVSAQAATAGMTSTEAAANALVRTLNSYSAGANEATHYSDVLFRIVDRGMITFPELASQIGDAATNANIAGVPIEELGAAIATMTKKGTSASETMTGLNNLMLAYIRPAKGAKEAAEKYGITLSASELRTKGLAGVLAELNDKIGGNVEAFAQLFPNVRGLKAILKLAGEDVGMFTEDMAAMNDVAGATANAYGIMSGTMESDTQGAANAMDAFRYVIGNEVIPIVTQFVKETLLPMLQAFMALPQPVKQFIVKALMVAAVLGPILMGVGLLTKGVGALIPVFSKGASMISGIGGALGLLTGPAGPILLIVAALALLVIAWKNNWGDIQGITARVVESLKTFFSNLGASLAETWNSIKTGVVNAWNAIGDALYNAGQSVMRRLSEGIRAAVDWVTGAVGWVVQKIRDLLPGSDAKEGPLSDLFASGKALPMTMAQGILSGAGAVQSAGQRIAAMAKYGAGPAVGRGGPVPIGAGGASYAAPAGGAGQAITITVNNPTGQTSEASIVRQLRNLAYVGALAP